ncbi:hypothetical protein Tco_1195654, partial [Tanacetum coccineum]
AWLGLGRYGGTENDLKELELNNPTDVVFEVNVSVQTYDSTEFTYPKTRIDRDYASRVLIPLEHFKLHVLDGSVLLNIAQSNRGNNTKSELNASIKDLISNIKVRWESGRSSSGELHIKDATQEALQTSVMDKKKVAFVKRPKKLPQQQNVDLLHEKNDASIYGFKPKGNLIPEKKCNNLKDFFNVARPMGVAHVLMPSKTISPESQETLDQPRFAFRIARTETRATDALWHIYSLGSFNTICDATQGPIIIGVTSGASTPDKISNGLACMLFSELVYALLGTVAANGDSVPLPDIGLVDTPFVVSSDVYYIPCLTMNLASVSKICDSRSSIEALGKLDAYDISDFSGCKLAKFSALPFSNSVSSSNALFDLVMVVPSL